jgi:hypothetical protein
MAETIRGNTVVSFILIKSAELSSHQLCWKHQFMFIFISFTEIYRQRKRSKSKVKTQERKSETEDDRHLNASTTSKTASVLGGASKSSQESD